MKNFLAAALFALLLVGCDKSNPIENSASSDALFGEETMYKTTITSEDEMVRMHGNGPAHDSLRHGRMLGHLKRYVRLTDVQMDSVKVYAITLFNTMKGIRTQVRDSLITRAQARELVKGARDQFVSSIRAILTTEQVTKFDEWVKKFWNKHPRRHGHGGRGGPRP